MVVHDRYGNCTPLDYEPPAELLRRGQDLHGTVSSWQKGRARVRQPALGMQALVAEVEQLEAEQGGKARPGRGSEVRRRVILRRLRKRKLWRRLPVRNRILLRFLLIGTTPPLLMFVFIFIYPR